MKQSISKLAQLSLFTLAAAGTSLASSTTCVDTNLALIVSCTWTNDAGSTITFSNFNIANNDDGRGGTVAPANWSVQYTDLGNSFAIKLTPNPSITEASSGLGQGANYQFLWAYDAFVSSAAPGGGGNMVAETAGLVTGPIVTNAGVQFVKTVSQGSTGNITGFLTAPSVVDTTGSSIGTFAPQTAIHIFDSVNVSGGNLPGSTSTLVSFSNTLSVDTAVPEPVTMSLMGAGLLALGFLRRRIGRR